MRRIVVGDLHGRFDELNHLINKKHPDRIYAVGDFGIWKDYGDTKLSGGKKITSKPKFDYRYQRIKAQDTEIYFCDGNHEDHDHLDSFREEHGVKPIEIHPNVFYCPRGTLLEDNGIDILFMGGADSIDKKDRTIKLDWFPQEVISYKDFEHLPDARYIDVVISHTCPDFLVEKIKKGSRKGNDPSTKAPRGYMGNVPSFSLVFWALAPQCYLFRKRYPVLRVKSSTDDWLVD